MVYKTLEWNIDHEVGYLVLNRPPANPMTMEFFSELGHLTKSVISTQKIKGMIITGRGRHFSSGADLKELTESINHTCSQPGVNEGSLPGFMKRNLDALGFFSLPGVPVVAAINGVCLGAGFELALFSHFRLGSVNTVVGLPESTYGLIPGLGGIQKLIAITDKVSAMEMVFKGSTFIAEEALGKGLIDRIIPKGQLIDAAQKLVEISYSGYNLENKNQYLTQLDTIINF